MNNPELLKLIKLYESVIHGDGTHFGLMDCYDNYYKDCWNKKFKQIEILKKKLNQT